MDRTTKAASEPNHAGPAAERVDSVSADSEHVDLLRTAAPGAGGVPGSFPESPRLAAQGKLIHGIQNSPRTVAQRKQIERTFGDVAQLEGASEKARPANDTGLPDALKSGIESLSGMSMDHVRVHSNSDKPATFQAHAYAQGSDIHVGPGQEQHLPHEAWHVVQQAQGRVQPTMQMKGGVAINDDEALEQEADVMGQKALSLGGEAAPAQRLAIGQSSGNGVAQMGFFTWLKGLFKKSPEKQRLLGGGSEEEEEPDKGGEKQGEEEGAVVEFPGGSYQNGVVTVPIWGGHSFSFDTKEKSGAVEGEIPSQTLAPDLPSLGVDVDIPVYPGIYATASLELAPTLQLEFGGGKWEIKASPASAKVGIKDCAITGSLGLDITAKAGVGVGVANVAGLGAGAFGTLGGKAELSGKLGGEIEFGEQKTYKLNLDLSAEATIQGAIGAYVEAKILILKATKKFPLAEKEFGKFEIERGFEVSNNGADLRPRLEYFHKTEFGDKSSGKRLKYVDGKGAYHELVDVE